MIEYAFSQRGVPGFLAWLVWGNSTAVRLTRKHPFAKNHLNLPLQRRKNSNLGSLPKKSQYAHNQQFQYICALNHNQP